MIYKEKERDDSEESVVVTECDEVERFITPKHYKRDGLNKH